MDARFGTADEFNDLEGGVLVRETALLRPRPTFSLILIPDKGQFTVIAPSPSLDSFLMSREVEWLDQPGTIGQLVVVPGSAPCNVIANLPRLRASPVALVPLRPNDISEERWLGAGLLTDQCPLWSGGGHNFDMRIGLAGSKWEYIDGDPENGIRPVSGNNNLDPPGPSYTKGIVVDPDECDFAVLRLYLQFIRQNPTDLQTSPNLQPQFAPGEYTCDMSFQCIEPSDAYDIDGSIPIEYWFVNRFTSGRTDIPTTTIALTGEMPAILDYPRCDAFYPKGGGTGTSVTVLGNRLARATSIEIAGHSAQIISRTDESLTCTSPSLTASGQVLVKTPFGWVYSADDFSPTDIINRRTLSINSTHNF